MGNGVSITENGQTLGAIDEDSYNGQKRLVKTG